MAILAGIDEAGYGPTLGPLSVSAVAFRVPDDLVDACLWDKLKATCTNSRDRSGRRLAIADSKKIYSSRANLAPLERPALVMLATAGQKPLTFSDLLKSLTPGTDERRQSYPWYADTKAPLPTCREVGDVGTRANALKLDMRKHRIELALVACEILLEQQFNRLVNSTQNKAIVHLGLVLSAMNRVIQASRGEKVRLYIDRLGGRQHYREVLTTSWPSYNMEVLMETPETSAYRLSKREQTIEIAFSKGSEDKHFPVAMASIYAKYLRELFMQSFNRYWCSQSANLKPTAGYYTDAKRWLRDVAPVLRKHDIAQDQLVRVR